jgi:hypothetical protein
MNLHLAEISRHVTLGAQAVVLLDGAGWHRLGGQLRVPDGGPDGGDATRPPWRPSHSLTLAHASIDYSSTHPSARDIEIGRSL